MKIDQTVVQIKNSRCHVTEPVWQTRQTNLDDMYLENKCVKSKNVVRTTHMLDNRLNPTVFQ